MRVLLVNDLPPGPTGGAEVHVGRLDDALEAAGCTTDVFVAERPHEGRRRALDLWDPFARRSLATLIRSFRPDVVHYHNILNELSTSVVGLGVPSVLTVHDPRILGTRFGLDQDRFALAPAVLARSAKDRLARFRLRRAVDATIVPNRSLAERARHLGFPSVDLVENFTPIPPWTSPGTDVVFVGALEPHKGPAVLLAAWEGLVERHPEVTLRFVGDGSCRRDLEGRVDVAGIERVELVGSVDPDTVPELLAGAAVVVVPSLGAENCPLVVLEAMATGRAVVVSDWPGVADTVDADVGAVVPAGDVAALAVVLDELLLHPEQLRRMADAARARAVERWSPAHVDSIIEIYEAVQR